ncbi:MAG: hypothetical protein M1835_006005 [Candelina submexicana]|nr:MAG: hypothetical protein M1835_006005 [Candelina submexicana]
MKIRINKGDKDPEQKGISFWEGVEKEFSEVFYDVPDFINNSKDDPNGKKLQLTLISQLSNRTRESSPDVEPAENTFWSLKPVIGSKRALSPKKHWEQIEARVNRGRARKAY